MLWAKLGPLSHLVGRLVKPLDPPTLLVSLPRSGSSWVGSTLGLSDAALYLREPISQPHLRRHKRRGVVFQVGGGSLPAGYQACADRAFAGVPAFAPNVVRYPGQWRLAHRKRRRIVIKEVNPLALEWLIERFKPKVIYLVRHPAAVAASFARLGWMVEQGREGDERRFSAARIGFDSDRMPPFRTAWGEHAALQGLIMRSALDALRGSVDHLEVRYEDLCAEPVEQFRRLYDFAGLSWNLRVDAAIRAQTGLDEHNRYESYSLYRNSRAMREAWRQDVDDTALADMKSAYLASGLPYYGPEEW